jgi:regulator of protease activity HflC (stomatin/prohibitin superfamily)
MLTPTFVLGLLAATAVAALACVRRIPEGHAYTLRRLGGHLRTIGAGTHIVCPLIERVAHRIRLLGNVVRFGPLAVPESSTRYAGQIYYQVLDAGRADAVIDDLDRLVCSRLPLLLGDGGGDDDTARDLRIKAALNQQLRDRGILITRVQIAAE